MAAENTLDTAPQLPIQALMDRINALSAQQKMAGLAAIAAAIAILVGVWLWSKQTPYAVLFSNVAEKDGGAIVAALAQQNVPYKVEAGGSTITVPAERANELRLLLASQGLPKGGFVGFELLDTQKFGMSQFNEQITYQRALEGELARTIQSLSAVGGARVHLAIPKQTAFLRDEQKPTASVMLALAAGRTLDAKQIAGIVHLVSSSVPQLASDQVSVIDQNGNLLTAKRDGRSMGLDSTQLGYVNDLENSYIKRIESILTPVLGAENFRAQVMADVDFDATEQTSETYKPNPNPNTAVRSQQTAQSQTNSPGASGVPGALSNQPPVPATAPITTAIVPNTPNTGNQPLPLNSTRNETINYELDKTISHVKRSLGSVKRLSVAVVVNFKQEKDAKGNVKAAPLSEAELKKVSDLVREAVGYNTERGDTLNLANSAFNEAVREEITPLPFYKDSDNIMLGKELLRYAVVLLVFAFVWRGIIKPLMNAVTPPPVEAAESTDNVAPHTMEELEKRAAEAVDDEEMSPEVLEAEIAKMSFDKKVSRAKEITAKDPRVVAQLMKEWMGGGSGGH